MQNDTIGLMDELRLSRKDAVIQFRLTPELKKALDELAKAKGVTVARLFEHSLANTFEELKPYLPQL